VTCRLCGSSQLRPFYTQGNDKQFHFYRCPECSLVNLDLTHGTNQEKYGEVFVEHCDESAKQNRMQIRSWKYIKGIHPAGFVGKVLDIGCGNGALLRMAQLDGWEIQGVELLESLAEGASRSLNTEIIQCDFLEWEPTMSDCYDLIVMRHVLEHIPDCREVIDKCAQLLAPGGRLYFEVPNIDGLTFKMKRFGERTGIHRHIYKDNYIPGHCNEYNRQSMMYLASTAGMQVVHWSTYSSKASMDWLYQLWPIATKARAVLTKQ
jgi:2-polyprenyl-3-methyl-5-hydroxy-6-metoxy-1,4-benzoquinol methylase